MERLIKVLIELLVSKGMELTSIPAFIRNLANALAADPYMSLEELNTQIHMLGWENFDLDLCTLQLVLATFDSDLSPRITLRVGSHSLPVQYHEMSAEKAQSFTYQIDHRKVVHID